MNVCVARGRGGGAMTISSTFTVHIFCWRTGVCLPVMSAQASVRVCVVALSSPCQAQPGVGVGGWEGRGGKEKPVHVNK